MFYFSGFCMILFWVLLFVGVATEQKTTDPIAYWMIGSFFAALISFGIGAFIRSFQPVVSAEDDNLVLDEELPLPGAGPKSVSDLVEFIEQKRDATPQLPCRVDEMTEREQKMFLVISHLDGLVAYIQSNLDKHDNS